MSPKWIDAIKAFTDGVKQGVLTNDMKLIQDSLEAFMEERLAGMSVSDIDKKQKVEENLDAALQERLDREDSKKDWKQKDGDDFTMPVSDDVDTSRQRFAKSKSLNLEDRQNQFKDDGSIEIGEAGSDLINDKSTNPVQRSRKPSEGLMNATCHLCGKVELIPPSLKREHYRCSACCKG